MIIDYIIVLKRKFQTFKNFDNSKKIKKISYYLILLIKTPVLLIVKGISCIKPFYIVSLGEKGRLSIMISYLEPFIRKLKHEGDKKSSVIVLNNGRDPNKQLSLMYGRQITLLDDRHPFLRSLVNVLYKFLNNVSSVAPTLRSGHTKEWTCYWNHVSPALCFNDKEENKGNEFLSMIGIRNKAQYICFGIRESNYYKEILSRDKEIFQNNPSLSSSIIEDSWVRNPLLDNYIPMMNQSANNDLYVFRMGSVVDQKLPTSINKKIIDYSTFHRNEFLDIYLLSKCKFCVAAGSGLSWVASAFNRPVVTTDLYDIFVNSALKKPDLTLPMLLREKKTKRLLSLREMSGFKYYDLKSILDANDLEFVHNTPVEICEIVEEMNDRLDGKWIPDCNDDDLQKQFNSLLSKYNPGTHLCGNIGAKFLRKNQFLLD